MLRAFTARGYMAYVLELIVGPQANKAVQFREHYSRGHWSNRRHLQPGRGAFTPSGATIRKNARRKAKRKHAA